MLIRQTLLYLPAQVLGPLFQFVAVVAWTHFLSPYELGIFALVAAAQELAYTAVLFWFSLYTLRYYNPEGDAEVRTSYLNTESAVLVTSSVVTALGLFAMPLLVDGDWSWHLLASVVLYSVTRGAVSQYSDRARAEHDTVSYTVLQICWPVLGLALGLLFIQIFGPVTEALLVGYGVAQTISLIVAIWRLGYGSAPHRVSAEAVRRALGYGLPLVGGAVLIWVANNGIRFVVEHGADAAAVGLLTVGWGLGMRATSFASMLTTAAAFPVAMKRAREGGMDEGQAQLVRNGELLLAALVPIAFGLWSISEPLVNLVVAEQYRAVTIAVLPLAVLAGAVRSFRIHFGEQVFLLREAPMVPLVNDGIDAVASLAGSYYGLKTGGIPGAAAGCAAAAILSLLVTMAWGWVRYRFALSLGGLARIVAAAAAMELALSRFSLQPTAWSIAGAIIAGAVVYTAVLVALYPEARRKVLELRSGAAH